MTWISQLFAQDSKWSTWQLMYLQLYVMLTFVWILHVQPWSVSLTPGVRQEKHSVFDVSVHAYIAYFHIKEQAPIIAWLPPCFGGCKILKHTKTGLD